MLYNEQNRNGRWYNGQSMTGDEVDDWYADETENAAPQPEESAPEAPPASPYFQPSGSGYSPRGAVPTPPGKQVNAAWRVIAIVALCLLAASVGVFRILANINLYFSEDDSLPSVNFSTDWDDSAADSGIDEDADMFEYFEQYYTSDLDISIPAADTGTGVTLTFSPTTGADMSLQDIYKQVNPAVVSILCYQDGQKFSWGSGVIFTADGYIITNTHVLQGVDAADVKLSDGETYSARLVGSDTTTDIAVLKIQGQNLPYADFADSANCQVGDEVVAIGDPLSDAYAGTMTNGIISGIDRALTNNGYSVTMLQTNAALNNGNSGGPLINSHGQVIGITNSKIMFTYSAVVEGIGFAIPSSVIKPVVDSIIEYGYVPGQPALGIVAGSVSEEAMLRYGLPEGIYVTSVDERSDAYAQGIRVGDVITAVNGTPVTSVNEVNAIKDGLAVGDEITCTVFREGDSFDIRFRLIDKGAVS